MPDPLLKSCFPHLLKMVWIRTAHKVTYVKNEDPMFSQGWQCYTSASLPFVFNPDRPLTLSRCSEIPNGYFGLRINVSIGPRHKTPANIDMRVILDSASSRRTANF
jgi:hypothetical protein